MQSRQPTRCRSSLLAPPKRRAFTLVELLVSSLLAVVLMAALAGLLRASAAQSKSARLVMEKHPPSAVLETLLRRDLANARYVDIQPNRIRLQGYLAHDLHTRTPTLRPAEVLYEIAGTSRGAALVRQETQRTELGVVRGRREAVWDGAARLHAVRFEDRIQTPANRAAAPAGMSPMPEQLIIVVMDRDGDAVCTVDVLHHQTIQ